MTIARVNGTGWAVGDKLTSAQGNAMDINVTNALDKRAGQTDALASVVSLTGAGRVIRSTAVGADAATTYTVDGGALLVRVSSAVTANRVYTINTTNAGTGDEMTFFCDPTFAFEIQIKSPVGGTLLYTLGNLASSDGNYCTLMFNGSAWQLETNLGARLRSQVFTASGTFNVPQGVSSVLVIGCGGGGGGSPGIAGTTGSNVGSLSGAGGGGAMLSQQIVGVTPGGTAAVVIGAGGSSGANGTSTTFAGTSTATMLGGGGGYTDPVGTPTASAVYLNGGPPFPTNVLVAPNARLTGITMPSPGSGGYATTVNTNGANGLSGAPSSNGFAGGTGGAVATQIGTSFLSGAGGGGGGAGPFGVGANGGGGGAGSNIGAGQAGFVGSTAAANAGAGGGGGGGGGCGSSSGGANGGGGGGGSGQLLVVWVK